MWLRTIRAAERGQDGEIGIAGKSPPKPDAGPRSRPPSVSHEKPGSSYSRSPPRCPVHQGYSLCPTWWLSMANATRPPSPCSPLGPQLISSQPRTGVHPGNTLAPFLILKTPMPGPCPHSLPFLAPYPLLSPLLTRTWGTLTSCPGFPKPRPGSCPLDTGDTWESPNFLCLLLPHRWAFLLITFLPLPGETFQKDTSVLDSQHSPQQMPLPLLFSSPLSSSYFSSPEGEFF